MQSPIESRARDSNLLVLSDLHLGCDLKPGASDGDERRAGLDAALVRFLDHHAGYREQGKRWRLLLAGDVFDFVAVTTLPAPGLTAPFEVRAEERLFGLAPEEEKCVWKLRRIAGRHEQVFHALARFLVAGNELQLIRGNHDAELQFPAVQRELVRLLARRAGVEGAELGALERRVQFHDWFYLEPGLLYLEHGNAHDRYCLQTGFFDAPSGAELELPMSSKVLRYFANRWAREQEDLDHADQMSAREYLAWVFRMGNPLQIAASYFAMVFRVLLPIALETLRRAIPSEGARMQQTRRRAQEQRDRVQGWLERFVPASGAQAARLFAAASMPAEQSLFASLQLFYLDRMALLLTAASAGAGGLLFGRGALRLLWPLAAGALFALCNALLARQRRCDARLLLQEAAARIAKIFDVRFVAMGHSHHRADERLSEKTRYLNLGAWSPGGAGLPHLAVIAEQAELRTFAQPASQRERRSPFVGRIDERPALA